MDDFFADKPMDVWGIWAPKITFKDLNELQHWLDKNILTAHGLWILVHSYDDIIAGLKGAKKIIEDKLNIILWLYKLTRKCDGWGSNPGQNVGNVPYYHYTTIA